jgi:hypothetical protein
MYNPHRPGPSFGPSYGAPATRETAVNTGGVAGAGRVVRRPKPDVPLGRQIDKMRILIPLFKGLGLKENLRRLLLAQSTLEAARQGETVRIVRGTPV